MAVADVEVGATGEPREGRVEVAVALEALAGEKVGREIPVRIIDDVDRRQVPG